MIDYVKLNIIPQDLYWVKQLQENPLLDFKTVVSLKTGEKAITEEAEYKGLKFIIYESGTILLKGSLHKYWNNDNHNYNDFTYNNLVEVINDLKSKFNLNLKCCLLRNVEVGVNIIPPISSKRVLDDLLIHLTKKFKDMYVPNGNCKQVNHDRYKLKAYDKKMQYEKKYKILNEILRVELHYNKMFDLKEIGVITLEDLLNKTKLRYLRNNLLKAWDETLLFDRTIIKKELNKKQRIVKLNQWQNPNYWIDLKKQRRNEQKRSYNLIVKNHSQQIHKQLYQLVCNKFNFLLNNSLPSNQDYYKDKSLLFNSSIIGLNSNNIPPIIGEHYL